LRASSFSTGTPGQQREYENHLMQFS